MTTALDQIAAASSTQAQQAASQRDQQALADDFDTFLQLLTTQLRNQDPLEPMDTNQFTQQLVQFSGVEQQIQTNSYLETLIQSTEAQSVNTAVNYIGSNVRAAGTVTKLEGGSASWDLITSTGAPDSVISIYDEAGKVVYSTPYSVERGETTFTWDGKTNAGTQLDDGNYSIRVEGKSSDGSDIPVYTAIHGQVTGVDFTGNEPVLLMDNIRVSLGAVMSIQSSDT